MDFELFLLEREKMKKKKQQSLSIVYLAHTLFSNTIYTSIEQSNYGSRLIVNVNLKHIKISVTNEVLLSLFDFLSIYM
jgi:hypothetical protein